MAAGYTIAGDLGIGEFTAIQGDAPPIDVLALDAPWVADALASPNTDAAGIPFWIGHF